MYMILVLDSSYALLKKTKKDKQILCVKDSKKQTTMELEK